MPMPKMLVPKHVQIKMREMMDELERFMKENGIHYVVGLGQAQIIVPQKSKKKGGKTDAFSP